MIPVGSHPVFHPVFETLAYVAGYLTFRSARARRGDTLAETHRWTIIASAAVGALAGSRLLGVAEQWPTLLTAYRSHRLIDLLLTPGGKSIVGGLLGGWLAVELAKVILGIRSRTGDLFALPLCVGIAVGRIGCFIAGLADDTYGKPTRLPWGVDFDDGIPRHPVQLYEILFLAILAFVVSRPATWAEGTRFRIFLAGYLSWRIVIDFFKPQPLIAGMNLIQWACVVGLLAVALLSLNDMRDPHRKAPTHAAVA